MKYRSMGAALSGSGTAPASPALLLGGGGGGHGGGGGGHGGVAASAVVTAEVFIGGCMVASTAAGHGRWRFPWRNSRRRSGFAGGGFRGRVGSAGGSVVTEVWYGDMAMTGTDSPESSCGSLIGAGLGYDYGGLWPWYDDNSYRLYGRPATAG